MREYTILCIIVRDPVKNKIFCAFISLKQHRFNFFHFYINLIKPLTNFFIVWKKARGFYIQKQKRGCALNLLTVLRSPIPERYVENENILKVKLLYKSFSSRRSDCSYIMPTVSIYIRTKILLQNLIRTIKIKVKLPSMKESIFRSELNKKEL